MKIAYLSGAWIPSRGANSVHVMRMCPAMARLGHQVVLHVPRGEAATEDDFAFYGTEPTFRIEKHLRLKTRVLGALAYAGVVRRACIADGLPELFYAREVYSLGAVASLGVPFCFESHWRPKNPVQQRLETWLLSRPNCARVVLISDALRQLYEQLFPWFPKSRLVVAHDAADTRAGVETPAAPSPRLRVGYVGSFFRGYGIEMVPRLAAACKDMDFHVIGGDPDAVDRWRAQTRQLPNLKFHGFISPRLLPEMYANLDVLLAPYQADTPHIEWISPMKLFEYMSFGKAIICADHAVMREILTDDVNALLVPPADENAWRLALTRLQDVETRTRLAQNALALLTTRHTWDQRARDVLKGLG